MKKILVFEDDDKLQAMYKALLAHEGFEPHMAGTGPAGLDMLLHDRCDLILLDIMMPGGLNGFDVLTKLKQNPDHKDIPVIIMSNLDSERQTGLDLGANDYIVKADADPQDVINKIKQYLPKEETTQA